MEVILLETIDGLGRRGSVVTVRHGFGRNYLLPLKKAVPATKDNLFRLQRLKKKFEEEESRLLTTLSALGARIDGFKLVLKERTTPEGHLFGSVSAGALRGALLMHGIEVPEKAIRLAEHIKAVGTYSIPVRLHSDVLAHFTAIVESENVQPEAPTVPAVAAPAASA